MAGLTAEGLEIKRLADLQVDLEARLVSAFGPNTRTGPDSVFGQLAGVFNAELALVWELAQQLYDGQNRNAAEGAQLDNLGNLIGIGRLGATRTTGTITATGTAGTTVPAGTVVENSGTGDRFRTADAAIIGSGGTVDIAIEGTETGPLEGLATEIDEIITPVSGLDSVENAEDVLQGRDQESDAAYRVRQVQSLQFTGAGVDLAIRSAVAAINGVLSVTVTSNRTAATVDTIPPHAFECVVYPDTGDTDYQEEIAETIFRRQPAGIEAFGSSAFHVTDQQNNTQQVGYTFATEEDYYMEAIVTEGASYPADGDDQVAAALLAEGNALTVGDDIKIWKFIAALDDIPGITDVVVQINTTPSPTNTANIVIDSRTIAIFDSARITVVAP